MHTDSYLFNIVVAEVAQTLVIIQDKVASNSKVHHHQNLVIIKSQTLLLIIIKLVKQLLRLILSHS